MGKRSRKSKAKKSDFQKVKLKVGKKKPLPNNVTDVAFKSQGIYIPEQLKNVDVDDKSVDDDFSKRKHNVAELLGQVGHFNANFRNDALTTLRMHLGGTKELIAIHLPKVIEKIPRTMVDQIPQVRKSSISFFKMLFSNLTEKEISPFFHIILSHLYCAMSHIYDDVQRDSLQIVDLCIEYFPNLITGKDQSLLLQHFIEMISTKQRSSAANKGSKDAKGVTRVLSLKLLSKESSISWRVNVLRRLYAILQTSQNSPTPSVEGPIIPQMKLQSKGDKSWYDPENGFVVRWDSGRIGEFLTSYKVSRLSQPSISLRSNKMGLLSSMGGINDATSSPWELITTLFPLMFDCWHEVCSDEKKTTDTEAVSTMTHVLSIVILLCKRFIESKDGKLEAIMDVRNAYSSQFDQYFISSFPLGHRKVAARKQRRKQQQKPAALNLQTDMQNVNLSICELVTLLALETELQKDAEILSSVAMYISSLLVTGNTGTNELDETTLKQIIATKRRLLEFAADYDTVGNLLHPLLDCCHTVTGSLKMQIMQFFLDLYSKGDSGVVQKNSVMTQWVSSLPALLLSLLLHRSKQNIGQAEGQVVPCISSASTKGLPSGMLRLALSCMRLASVRQDGGYLDASTAARTDLLSTLNENADKMFCQPCCVNSMSEDASWCHDCADLQARIFEVIILHLPPPGDVDMRLIAQLCHQVIMSAETAYYVSEMLIRKMLEKNSTKQEHMDSLLLTFKFICSMLLGAVGNDVQSRNPGTSSPHKEGLLHPMIDMRWSEAPVSFFRHCSLVERLCELLPTLDHVYMFVQQFLCTKILVEHKVLPPRALVGILSCGKMLLSMKPPSLAAQTELISSIGKLCAVCLFAFSVPECDVQSSEVVMSLKKSISNLLSEHSLVLQRCIEHFASADLRCLTTCQAVCLAIEGLILDVDLYKPLNMCLESLQNLFEDMKVQCRDVQGRPWFKGLMNNFSIMLQMVE